MPRRRRRDTTITDEEKFLALQFGHNEVRSKKSRDVDNGTTKGLTKDFGRMWVDPSRNDWEGVDTVVRDEKFDRKKGKKAFDNITDIIGESGF